MIAVEVGKDDGVDGAAVDAGGGKIALELADRAFALLIEGAAPSPQSMTTSLEPVLTAIGVTGTDLSFSM